MSQLRTVLHIVAITVLTLVTQLGGLAWLMATSVRQATGRVLIFLAAYSVLWVSASYAAPIFGRVQLPCDAIRGEATFRAQSVIYCITNRNYVVPRVAALGDSLADHVNRKFPGTSVLYLDAGFPFFDWFPMLPHLSHRDGRRLDLALFYADREGEFIDGQTASPIGYWGFVDPPDHSGGVCADAVKPSLRWDMNWFQPLVRDLVLDDTRTGAMIRWLSQEGAALGVTKILLEPHLKSRLGLRSERIRFQGCRAARHDDHVHVEVKR